MTKPATDFGVKDRVTHFVYGPGTIAEMQHGYTTIDFDTNGRRKFLTSMVQLEPTDVLAPPPAPKKSRAKSAKTGK